MKSATLALLALSFLPLSAHSQRFRVSPSQHRPNFVNRTGGYCLWASTTTFLRGYGYRVDLVKSRRDSGKPGPTWSQEVNHYLSVRNVPHHYHPMGTFKREYPSVVSARWGRYGHGIVLLSDDGRSVRYLDPNHAGQTRSMPSATFRKIWTGDAIYLAPTNSAPYRRR